MKEGWKEGRKDGSKEGNVALPIKTVVWGSIKFDFNNKYLLDGIGLSS
jgi:hypothetical protein